MGDPAMEHTRERLLALGILDDHQIAAAVAEYRAEGAGSKFDSFLVARGLITPRQLGEIQPGGSSPDLDATMVGDSGLTPPGSAPIIAGSDPALAAGATYADAAHAPTARIPAPGGDPIIGGVFAGFRVERKLGQGGMGAVYLARSAPEEPLVVVKFLAREQASNPAWRGRFVREAEVMRRVSHPNVVAIHEVEAEGAAPFMVMEFVDGQPLDEALEERASFEPLEATRIARDMALGLAHAHTAGVIHRDVKPANVLLSKAGEVKLLDFGLAKNLDADDGLSVAGQVLGTPHYMAPEQWGDHMVDARCDVFSLGATLYHLITGEVPFKGRNPQAVARKVLAGEFDPPSAIVDLPKDLELVLFRMLELERSYRYPTAKAAAEDLQRILERQQVNVPRLIERRGERRVRHALLPGGTFVLGREDSCDIAVRHRSVSRQHARIDRGKTGFVLQDLGSTYGCFVGGMRIRTVVLKDKDEIKLGKVAFQFRDGGMSSATNTRRVAPDRLRVRTLPLPLYRVLAGRGDRRAVLGLLEELAPDAIATRVETTRRRLRRQLGGDVAEAVGQKLDVALRRRLRRVPQELFAMTHENLADDSEAWLSWWDQARSDYPAQIVPQLPLRPGQLRVQKGEPQKRSIPLTKHVAFSLGRDEKMRVPLQSLSVSRHHATIYRFHQRYVIRDEGSRFGTLVNGQRVRLAFLRPGDKLVMGKVELTFHTMTDDPSTTAVEGDVPDVDADAFFILAQLGHPATATGLIRFLSIARNTLWIKSEAQALFRKDPGHASTFGDLVAKAYLKRAEQAQGALAKMFGADRGDSPDAWQRLVAQRRGDLPTQLFPEAWFPAES